MQGVRLYGKKRVSYDEACGSPEYTEARTLFFLIRGSVPHCRMSAEKWAVIRWRLGRYFYESYPNWSQKVGGREWLRRFWPEMDRTGARWWMDSYRADDLQETGKREEAENVSPKRDRWRKRSGELGNLEEGKVSRFLLRFFPSFSSVRNRFSLGRRLHD